MSGQCCSLKRVSALSATDYVPIAKALVRIDADSEVGTQGETKV